MSNGKRSLFRSAHDAIIYSNYFDFPLTLDEIYDFMDLKTNKEELQQILEESENNNSSLVKLNGYWVLGSRRRIIHLRQIRKSIADLIRKQMLKPLNLLFKIPFIQMIAITGSLAVNNSAPNSDIDLLIITESNRVWLTRLLLFFFELYSEKRYHLKFCFNFIISNHNLKQRSNTIFTAHEIVQMVPIFGLSTYKRFLGENLWIQEHFPNLSIHKQYLSMKSKMSLYNPNDRLESKSANQNHQFLYHRLLNKIDFIEYRRAVNKIIKNHELTPETYFAIDEYKGHFDSHQQKMREALKST